MRKQLDGLRWEPAWMSEMGCLKGCLDFLGVQLPMPHLYGLTGFAFFINMHEVACPSSPTAWNSAEVVAALLPNLGAQAEFALGGTHLGNLGEAQANAWEMARRHLDAGLPVYGWELAVPEYYVVSGYDHTGYYYHGPGAEDGGGPTPWQELGAGEIGVVSMAGLKGCPATEFRAALADAVDLALRFAEPDSPWRLPNYTTGPAAFDLWANALASGIANEFGHRYCAAVWAECRHNAVRFLTGVAEQLPDLAASVQDALTAYRRVNVLLGTVSQEHVFLPPGQINMEQTLQSAESADMLRQAADAEAAGLKGLQRLAEALRG